MRYKEEIEILDRAETMMDCLGVETFAWAIDNLKSSLQDYVKEMETERSYECDNTHEYGKLISSLIIFNHQHMSYYGYHKDFDDIVSPIKILYARDGLTPTYGIGGKALNEDDVYLLVKTMVDKINKEADRTDH